MFKKVLSITMAAAMALAMFTTAFAARGYDLDKIDKETGTAITETTNKAVEEAKEAKSETAYVALPNTETVSPEVFKKVAEEAAKSGKEAKVMTDTVVGGVVQVRVILNPSVAAAQNKSVNMAGHIGNAQTEATFKKFFKNEIVVVDLGQPASYGQTVEVAARLNLSKLNANNSWYFYSYDPIKNEYRKIAAPNYVIDANGYLHFNTVLADKVVITDMPMTLR